MATKLYFHQGTHFVYAGYSPGVAETNLRGTATGFDGGLLTTTAGSSTVTQSQNSVAGPIAGLEVYSTYPFIWYSLPLAAAVTISGSITWNIWAYEFSMTANVAINGIIEKVDGATGAITEIDRTARVTELTFAGVPELNNFAETPAAGVACKKGDRLRVRIYGDDVGTMAGGIQWHVAYDGPTAAASGDTWMQLTENLTFMSEPAGTTVYLTNTASAVSTASVDRVAWTSRGGGVQNDVTNSVAGPTASIQVTDTAGGTVVDWFTNTLPTSTLSGSARINLWAIWSSVVGTHAYVGCEIARVAGDGTSPTVWARGFAGYLQFAGSPVAHTFLISGDDLAITSGQRLRIRLLIDDGRLTMIASETVTVDYASTAGGFDGDSFVTFAYDIEAAGGGPAAPHPTGKRQQPQLLAH